MYWNYANEEFPVSNEDRMLEYKARYPSQPISILILQSFYIIYTEVHEHT